MNKTGELAESKISSLQTLQIRECSFSFRGFFNEPRPLESINTAQLADAFLDTFREFNLSAADVVLEKGDSLFGYAFKAHLYNRLVSINVGAIAVEASFLRLVAVADRRIAADCIKKLIELFRPLLSQYCFFEAAIHADFSFVKDREDFFSRNADGGLDLGGILAYKKVDKQQLIRLEIDQSYTYPNGAFIDFRTMAMTLEDFLSSDPIWRRFFELVERFNLRLDDV
jgi:hypothetical protein